MQDLAGEHEDREAHHGQGQGGRDVGRESSGVPTLHPFGMQWEERAMQKSKSWSKVPGDCTVRSEPCLAPALHTSPLHGLFQGEATGL